MNDSDATARETHAVAMAAVEPFFARLRAKDEVEGIVLLSSGAPSGERFAFDTQSDLDLSLFVTVPAASDAWAASPRSVAAAVQGELPSWLPNFSFYVPVPWGSLELNIHQRILEHELDPRTVWDDDKREVHAYAADIVFDRRGLVADVLRTKTVFNEGEQAARTARLATRLEWDISVLPLKQAGRGHVVTAHYMLNGAVDELVEFALVAAGRFQPQRKWRLEVLRDAGVLDAHELALLHRALRATLSYDDLLERVAALTELWASLKERHGRWVPQDPYGHYSSMLSPNRQMIEETVADRVMARFPELPEAARDVINFLVPDSEADLARVLGAGAGALPAEWQPVAERIRDAVAGTEA